MFRDLKKSRSLIMGLAILWVAFYHIPWLDKAPWLDFIHDVGYIGVDVFLLISGIGAVHSMESRGRKGYLIQRVKRILPGLVPVLLVWSGIMLSIGVMNLRQFFGSITLTGWWLGQDLQLNWYFSAVWMYYLLGAALYRPVAEGKYPGLWVVLSVPVTLGLIRITPFWHHPTALTRIPVFLLGMLLGRMEKRGREQQARVLVSVLFPVGLVLVALTWFGPLEPFGDSLGLWWYPFALVVPGACFSPRIWQKFFAVGSRGAPFWFP